MTTERSRYSTVPVELLLSGENGLALIPPGSSVTMRLGRVNTPANYQLVLTDSGDGITFVGTIPKNETALLNDTYTVTFWVAEPDGTEWPALQSAIKFSGVVLPKS